eukprot:jgi/Tetstr1/434705/TSEL_002532.t1
MPLPPPSITGGKSAAPFTRNEDMYAWEFDQGDMDVFEEYSDSEDENVGTSMHILSRNYNSRQASVRRISSDGEEEHELVRKGQAFMKRGLPPKLKEVFRLTIAERESFDSKQEFMLHLKRNIHLDRQWMKKRTTEAVEKRDKKQAAQKAQEASAQAKREKERKFVRRHGYKPDVFPDLPKFRMPKDAKLDRKLDKLDKVLIGKMEQQDKLARKANKAKERERREMLSIADDLSDLSSPPSTAQPSQRSSQPDSQPAARAPMGRSLQTMPVRGPGSMAAMVGASTRHLLAAAPSARALAPLEDAASRRSSITDRLVSPEPAAGRAKDHGGAGKAKSGSVGWRDARVSVADDSPREHEAWSAIFGRKPRDRDHPEESILPILDDSPLQEFAKAHMAYKAKRKNWRTVMRTRARSRIMDLHSDIARGLKPLLKNPLHKKKEVTRSRLTVAEQFMYTHLDALHEEQDRTGRMTMAQIETAKRVAVVLREEAVFGKDDPRLDMVPHNLARRHSFDWRAALDTDSAPPLAAVDLWGLLQLLAVQFEPGSPGKGGRGAGAAAEAQLDRLEREAARIEGLFSAQGQTHSGLAVIDKDAAQFVKYTDKELGKLVAKYSKGQLAAPADSPPSPTKPAAHPVLFGGAAEPGEAQVADPGGLDDVPYAHADTQLSCATEEGVYLNHCNLTTYQMSAAVVMLSQVPMQRTVRKLCLAHNMLEDTHLCLLLDALDGTAGLQHLDVSFNRLKHHSATALAQHVARGRCTQLLELNLSHNKLGDRGVAALLEAVAYSPNRLEGLAISAVDVSERCAERLAEYLTNSAYLKHVDYSHNFLGIRGGGALGEALTTNGRLVRLNLAGCYLGDDGGAALIAGLAEAEDLRWVNLAANRLGPVSVTSLCAVLEANPLPNLTVLIGDNPLGRSAASQLIRLSTSAAVGRINMANANLHHIALSAGTAAAATVGNGSGAPAAATRATPSSTVSHLAVVAGSDITFDRTATHCVYRLSLKFPGNCLVLRELLLRWRKDGRHSWASCKLNGAPLRLNDVIWEEWMAAESEDGAKVGKAAGSLSQLPEEGELLVEFQTHNVSVPEAQAPVDRDYLRAALAEVDLRVCSEEWLMSFICALPSEVYLRAQDAHELLRCFTWSQEKVSAAAFLFCRLVDPMALDTVMRPALSEDEALRVDEALGLLDRLDPRNLTRHYDLDMGLGLDKLVASRLLGCWHAEVQAGCCEPARAAACWRNMRVNGQLVDGVGIDPSSYELPERGALAFDFVSYVEAGRGPLPRELSGDLMRSPHTLEAQASNPQLSNGMAAVMAKALVSEHIKTAEAIVEDMGAAAPGPGSQGDAVTGLSEYSRLEAEVARLAVELDNAKLAKAPKAEVKEKQAALAATKKQFAGLAHTGLVMKMTQAALGRIAAPDFGIKHGAARRGPVAHPGVPRGAPLRHCPDSSLRCAKVSPSCGAQVMPKKDEAAGKKGKGKKGKKGKEEVDVQRLLKVKGRNHTTALGLIRRVAGSYHMTSAQVDLLAALFDDAGHKAEVVVSCYQSIVDLRTPTFGRLLHVEVCRRLGWCNAVRLSVPNLHYRLNLDLRDDVAMLEKLLFLNCELSLNAGSNEYTTDEDNICCVRHLRIHDTLVEGPIPHNALAKHLMEKWRDHVESGEGAEPVFVTLDFRASSAALDRVATEEM